MNQLTAALCFFISLNALCTESRHAQLSQTGSDGGSSAITAEVLRSPSYRRQERGASDNESQNNKLYDNSDVEDDDTTDKSKENFSIKGLFKLFKRLMKERTSKEKNITPSGSAQGNSKLGIFGEFLIVMTWLFQVISFQVKIYLPRALQTLWSLWVKFVGGVADDAIDSNAEFNLL